MNPVERYPRIFMKLMDYGHSALKADQIIREAKSEDFFSLHWIKSICRAKWRVS